MEMVLRNLGRITITFFQENGLGQCHSDLSMSLKYLEYFKIKRVLEFFFFFFLTGAVFIDVGSPLIASWKGWVITPELISFGFVKIRVSSVDI